MRANRLIMNVIIASILGFALCLLIKSFTIHRDIQSSALFVAELEKDVKPGQRISAESLIKDIPYVMKSSVKVTSSAEALETMKKEMPELVYLADNPFRDVITFRTSDLQTGDLEQWLADIKEIRGIDAVFYDQALLEELA